MKILIKNDSYVKLIPTEGMEFLKEIGTLSGGKTTEKKFGLTNFIPEYWRLVSAGYVDQTDCFAPNKVNFSNISSDVAPLVRRLYNATLEESKSEYSANQILQGEELLRQIKISKDWDLIEKFCNIMMKPFDKVKDKESFIIEAEDNLRLYRSMTFFNVPEMKKTTFKSTSGMFEAYEIKKPVKGEKLMYHASPTYNWLSILSNGLQIREILHGNSYGKGIYLANEYDYAKGFSDAAKNFISHVGVFAVKEDERDDAYDWGKVVKNPANIEMRYLLTEKI